MLGNLVQMVFPHTPFLTDTLKCGLLVVYNGENGVFLSSDPRILSWRWLSVCLVSNTKRFWIIFSTWPG